jgi:DNA-binding MarR family transcriptional regulator
MHIVRPIWFPRKLKWWGRMYVGARMERRTSCLGNRRRRTRRPFEPITEAQWLCNYWVKRADRRVSSHFAQTLKVYGLIASEWAAMGEMYRPGRTSSLALAPAIGMTKGGASKLIDRLVRKGFARRKVGEFDRRCRPVGLTKRGKNLVVYLASREEEIDREFFPKEKLRYNLMRALKRVVHGEQTERVNVWLAPRTMASSYRERPEYRFYSASVDPPPSAVNNNASNSSGDSSRNLPRDK